MLRVMSSICQKLPIGYKLPYYLAGLDAPGREDAGIRDPGVLIGGLQTPTLISTST